MALAGLVGKLNPKNKVDLTSPELTIIVEVIKAVCCVSVVKDYMLYRKYNVQEVVKRDEPKPDGTAAKPESDTAEKEGVKKEEINKEETTNKEEEINKEETLKEEATKKEEEKGEEDCDRNVEENKEVDKGEGDGE